LFVELASVVAGVCCAQTEEIPTNKAMVNKAFEECFFIFFSCLYSKLMKKKAIYREKLRHIFIFCKILSKK
jgi:hypothetical protein